MSVRILISPRSLLAPKVRERKRYGRTEIRDADSRQRGRVLERTAPLSVSPQGNWELLWSLVAAVMQDSISTLSGEPGRDEAKNIASVRYLSSLLDKNLRIRVSDGRMFVGQFKCTDKHCNIILSGAQEYRASAPRYMGLIVVPGEHIRKIEMEEYDPSLSRT